MSELDAETKEFFESGGEKAPEEKEEVKSVVKSEPKTAEKTVEKPEVDKTEVEKKEPKEDEDDPHSENHRKALKEARAEMKRLKKEKAESDLQREKELGEMREKFRVWTEAVNKQNQPEPAKFEEDPGNYLKQEHEMTKRELSELRAWKQQQEQAYQQQAALNQFSLKLQSAEREFAKEAPDYDDAAKHVANVWIAEFEMAGVPQEQINQAYLFKVAQFTNSAMRRGDNPAESVYELAKRIGYSKKETVKTSEEKKIETIQKGQDASKSLGSGKSDAEFSLESLAGMSPAEIEAFVTSPKNWKKLA